MSRPVVVGVAGGSASGKSTVVHELVDRVGAARTTVLQHDAYYRDLSHLTARQRDAWNFDHPDALETGLMVDDVRRLLGGASIQVPVYDYATHTRTAERLVLSPAPLVVLEGILVLAEPRLRALMDLSVYVDVAEDERLNRRIERDVETRGRTAESVHAQHRLTVQPMHVEHVEPSRGWADVVIVEGGRNRPAIDGLAARVEALLNQSADSGTPRPPS